MSQKIFNEIAGINSRLASLVKKIPHQRQEINLQSNMQGSKCDEYCIFLSELFCCTESFLSLLTQQLFFKIFLSQIPMMFSTDLNQSVIYSFTQRVYKIAIKRDSSPKYFPEVTKEIEHLQQNTLDKTVFQILTQSKSSDSLFY